MCIKQEDGFVRFSQCSEVGDQKVCGVTASMASAGKAPKSRPKEAQVAAAPAEAACPQSYNRIGGWCYSSAREPASYADGHSSCQPVIDLCTSEDATLANKEQAEQYVDNGGTTLGKSYGLTSTTGSSGRHFFVTSGHQWGAGNCHHTNRWFVCAVLPQVEQ